MSFDPERGALGPGSSPSPATAPSITSAPSMAACPPVPLTLDRIENPKQFSNFEDGALGIDRARRIQEAMSKLTPAQKEVIELAYYEGLSQTEIAARLKQPLGTVKTWARTALRALREQLSGMAIA